MWWHLNCNIFFFPFLIILKFLDPKEAERHLAPHTPSPSFGANNYINVLRGNQFSKRLEKKGRTSYIKIEDALCASWEEQRWQGKTNQQSCYCLIFNEPMNCRSTNPSLLTIVRSYSIILSSSCIYIFF